MILEGQWPIYSIIPVSKILSKYTFPTPTSALAHSGQVRRPTSDLSISNHFDGDLSKKDVEGELSACKMVGNIFQGSKEQIHTWG